MRVHCAQVGLRKLLGASQFARVAALKSLYGMSRNARHSAQVTLHKTLYASHFVRLTLSKAHRESHFAQVTLLELN